MSPAAIPTGAFTPEAVQKLLGGPIVPIAANGAVDSHTANRYIITKAGVAALTLAAPTATQDDGLLIEVSSSTAFAHTLTATGLFADGGGHVNLATFAAQLGASILLQAYQGRWYVQLAQGVTMT